MKARLFFIVMAVLLGALSEVDFAVENPASLATVPPSSIRSGLVRSPNPVDTSGNLVVTGNVSSGKHFRGVVPYNAVSDFGGRLGTGTLDSFLRYSAGSGDVSRYAGGVAPYYSLTGTVTTTRLGQPGVIRPPTTRIASRVAASSSLSSLPKEQTLLGGGLLLPQKGGPFGGLRPMSMTPQEIERTILAEISTYTGSREVPDAREGAQAEGPLRRILQGELPTGDVWKDSLSLGERELGTDAEQFGQGQKRVWLGGEHQGRLPDVYGRFLEVGAEKGVGEAVPSEGGTDQDKSAYPLGSGEKVAAGRFQWDKLIPAEACVGETYVGKQDELESFVSGDKGVRSSSHLSAGGKVGSGPSVYEHIRQQIGNFGLPSTVGFDNGYEDSYTVGPGSTGKMSGMSYAAQAKAILGSHKGFTSFARAKFDEHVKAAEEYLKQGKYYRAADAYTLALVYEPEDPIVYGCKSHALFAAGEYMSSVLFLSRALEILSVVRSERGKMVEVESRELETLGSDDLGLLASNFRLIERDKIEDRMVDIEQWQRKSDSGELQFLLAYVYCQMGRFEQAKEAVGVACERMPEKGAVVILKEAVDRRCQESDVGGSSAVQSVPAVK